MSTFWLSFIITVLCLSLAGCGATSNPIIVAPPVTTVPSTGVNAQLAAAALILSCSVAEASVNSGAYLWLTSECPEAAASIVSIIKASGTRAQIQAVVTSLQASYTAIPAGTLTPHDQQVIGASLSGFQGILAIYGAA